MSGFLYGAHDFDVAWAKLITAQGMTGWATTTHEVGHEAGDFSGQDFYPVVAAGMTPIARLNNGYLNAGTIPLPQFYPQFAQRCRNFVAASKHCTLWIIGNEPNLAIERPGGPAGPPITARLYAECFVACRNAIKQVGSQHRVIIAAVGPWNVETGDWLKYWIDVLTYVSAHGGADGLALHSYTRSSNPSDVSSEDKMSAAGYTDRYSNFRAYQDTMRAIIPAMRHLPVYMTEANPVAGWQDANTGVVKAIYGEINGWNETAGTQKIKCVTLFRWPNYGDPWWIVGKQGVISDWQEAMRNHYISPLDASAESEQPTMSDPTVSPEPDDFRAEVDPRLVARGVHLDPAEVKAGQGYWRVSKMRWLDVEEARSVGPDHHILGVVRRNGQVIAGVPFKITWPTGEAPAESKPPSQFAFNFDFAMSKSLNEFAIQVADGQPSDVVSGIGMGKDGNPGIHTSTWIEWEWAIANAAPSTPSTPPSKPADKVLVPILVHPVPDAVMRTPSQGWGGNAAYYSQFKVDGVPLRGHNGLDFPTPVGTPVRAIADGKVKEAWHEENGFGNLVLLAHPFGESLYAHLDRRLIEPGDTVKAGQIIAISGASGKVTGPHLHFGLRVQPYDRQDGWGGYSDPTPYLGTALVLPVEPTPVPNVRAGAIDPVVAAAILQVESGNTAFGPGGRLVIRFEPHIFRDRPGVDRGRFDGRFRLGQPEWVGEHHRFLDPTDNTWKPFHGPINSHQQFEYRAFAEALKINAPAAYESISMGAAQVMGFNARTVGFGNAEQMFKTLSKSYPAQMMSFVNFVLANPELYDAMRRKDFETVARLYNGPANVASYASEMRAAYEKLLA